MSQGENECERERILKELSIMLHKNYGQLAPDIIRDIVVVAGGFRMTIPSIQDINREERNAMIRKRFTGANYEELEILFGLKRGQLRNIIQEV